MPRISVKLVWIFFFFKQRPSYEMRISDWFRRVLFRSMRALVTLAPVLARIQPGHGADWDMKLDHAMRPRARMARSSPRRLLNTSCRRLDIAADASRSEEHTSALKSLMRQSYAVFCLKKKQRLLIHTMTTQTNHIELAKEHHLI